MLPLHTQHQNIISLLLRNFLLQVSLLTFTACDVLHKTQVWDPGTLLSDRLLICWVLRIERVHDDYSYVRVYVYYMYKCMFRGQISYYRNIKTRVWVRGEIAFN